MTDIKPTLATLKKYGHTDLATTLGANFGNTTDAYGNVKLELKGGAAHPTEIQTLLENRKLWEDTIAGKQGYTPSAEQIAGYNEKIEAINTRLATLGEGAQKEASGLMSAVNNAQNKLIDSITKAQEAATTRLSQKSDALTSALGHAKPETALGKSFVFEREVAGKVTKVDLVKELSAKGVTATKKTDLIKEAIGSVQKTGQEELKALQKELADAQKGFAAKTALLSKHQTELHTNTKAAIHAAETAVAGATMSAGAYDALKFHQKVGADIKANWKSGWGGAAKVTVGAIGVADGIRRAVQGAVGMMSSDPEKKEQAGLGTLVVGIGEIGLAGWLARSGGRNHALGISA